MTPRSTPPIPVGPSVTDEGRRLLEEATPLPWFVSRVGEPSLAPSEPWRIVTGNEGEIAIVRWRVRDEGEPDADVIAFAVNHLPAFLAAVEALERLVRAGGYLQDETGIRHDMFDHEMKSARAALAPFTEEPSDD